jgi:hypothetical protein
MSSSSAYRHEVLDARNLADLYELPLMDWSAITARMDRGISQEPGAGGPSRHTYWLTTLNPDGSPHVTGIGALWFDSVFWFETGERTRKGRNLARDPRCALNISTEEFDLVVEGTAEQITEPAAVAELAKRWAAEGWPARPDDSGQAVTAEFSAPSAGPPPWHVYRLTPHTATAVGTVAPFGATRWQF